MNYLKIYNNLMESRKKCTTFSAINYWEKHHIIPKCLGGSNAVENLVLLTAREHYIAHQLLMKAYPENRNLSLSFECMLWGQDKRRITAKQFEKLKEFRSKNRKGIKFSEEHIKNLSIAQQKRYLNNPVSEETKQKISEANKGKVRTEEQKDRLSNSKMGIKFSEEHKKSLSEAWKTRENKNPNKGRKHTEEEIEKMKEAWKTRKLIPISEETRQKLSEVWKGRSHTEESKQKMSEAHKGKKNSPESYQKMWETRRNNKS